MTYRFKNKYQASTKHTMAQYTILLLIFSLIPVGILSLTNTCSKQANLYEEWQCKPIYGENKICAEQYDCTNAFKKQENQCFFQGKFYNSSQKVSGDGLKRFCYLGCFCQVFDGQSRIICAVVDCAYYFSPRNKTCLPVYNEIDQCCPQELCEPFTGKAQCKFENKTYYEGQRVIKEKCSTCLCTKKGIICEKNKCLVELRQLEKIQNKCAPVYSEDSCCPVDWLCYNKTTDLIIPKKIMAPTKLPKCSYGNMLLNLGDFLIRPGSESQGYLCTCKLPPMLTCWSYEIPDN